MTIADNIALYAALRREMLDTYQTDADAYQKAEAAMREVVAALENTESGKQAIYYQNIIIDCERQMPLPAEPGSRIAGSYKVHRYTEQDYKTARESLAVICRSKNIEPGDVFGEWTVCNMIDKLHAWCRCSCGVERKVYKYSLLEGESTSCGHRQRANQLKQKRAELVGQTFGEWTVLDVLPKRLAVCRCSCGTIREVLIPALLSGVSKSCGCKRLDGRERESQKALEQGRATGQALHDAGLAMTYLDRKINRNSSTGITGVGIYKDRRTGERMYRAYIMLQRRQISLGIYRNIEDAVAARKRAEEKYFAPLQERVDEIKGGSKKEIKIF